MPPDATPDVPDVTSVGPSADWITLLLKCALVLVLASAAACAVDPTPGTTADTTTMSAANSAPATDTPSTEPPSTEATGTTSSPDTLPEFRRPLPIGAYPTTGLCARATVEEVEGLIGRLRLAESDASTCSLTTTDTSSVTVEVITDPAVEAVYRQEIASGALTALTPLGASPTVHHDPSAFMESEFWISTGGELLRLVGHDYWITTSPSTLPPRAFPEPDVGVAFAALFSAPRS